MRRSLGGLERFFHLSALLQPLVPVNVVDRDLPAFWRAEDENSDMLLRGIKGSHERRWYQIFAAATRIAVTHLIAFKQSGFGFGKGRHSVSFQRVMGNVRHEFHGSVFLRKKDSRDDE